MKQLLLVVLSLIFCNSQGQNSHPITAELDHQFDFWVGQWDVNLLVRQGDFSWKSQHQSVAKIFPVLDGRAILELWDEPGNQGIKGFSLRYYDFDLKKWVLWLNWPTKNRSGTSSLQGEFNHGRGEFFSTFKTQDGKDGITRYSFNDITATSLRWDDAFSTDGGKTWSNNWIMEFKRTKDNAEFENATTAHTYESGGRCDLAEFRKFEKLAGTWDGLVEEIDGNGKPTTTKATLTSYKVLGGCSIISFLEYGDKGSQKIFSLKTYNTFINKYADLQLSNEENSKLVRFFGDEKENEIALSASGDDNTELSWQLNDDQSVSFRLHKNEKQVLSGKFLRK